MSNAKSFDSLSAWASRINNNYLDGLTKLFLNLYLDKFLDTLSKSFFPCTIIWQYKNTLITFIDMQILE